MFDNVAWLVPTSFCMKCTLSLVFRAFREQVLVTAQLTQEEISLQLYFFALE
jgi:hypothetical protein